MMSVFECRKATADALAQKCLTEAMDGLNQRSGYSVGWLLSMDDEELGERLVRTIAAGDYGFTTETAIRTTARMTKDRLRELISLWGLFDG